VSCGTSLPELERLDAERKPVTVLVCDLAGFTARSDRADPEDVKATLRPFHARIVRELENHGGTLDKFIGDAVLGVFGAPVSHEDDPERAVRAAFRILDAIEELNEERPGLGLAARIGIDTGPAVVVLGPGPQVGERVTGEVVTRAGLLQGAAPVGGIAIGEPTYRATRDLFAFEALPLAAGAAAGPIEAWRPISVSRLVRERPKTPFVGRDQEAALLRAAYRRSVGGPSVQLVTVTGEPGIGKSRLVQEFAEDLDRERDIIRWRVGRCRPYGEGVAFAPLADIVKAEAGILESDPLDVVRTKLSRAVDVVAEDPAERDWLKARLGPLVGLGDPAAADRAESFTAWRRALEAMAAQHPTIVVLEDLHWADPALLDFVEEVVDRSSGLPLLVLCAARPELYERCPRWGGTRNATSVSLRPLSETEMAMLVSALLEPSALPAATRAALLERSGGNPLYAEEFGRMLADRAGPDDDTIAVPESVQALIAARLDTLPPDAKSILQDAAVLGRVFWAGAVAQIAGRPREQVEAWLNELSRQELIRPVRSSSIAGDREYAFWHVLVRDVAYGQIPRADRGTKHRTTAEWIEGAAGDRVLERAELLAHHYGLAVDLAGPEADADLRARAGLALVLAADRVRRLDAEAAERSLARALELFPTDHPERARALVRAGEVASALGRFAESRSRFDEAIAAFRSAGDTLALGDAMARQSRSLFRLGDARRSESVLVEAVRMLEAEPPGPELARAYARAAGNALIVGRWEECRDAAEKALALAERLGLPEETVRARQALGAARCEMGDEGGLADLWAALRQGTELGLGEETVVTYGNLAYQLWLRDGPTIALQATTSALEFAEVRGFVTEAMWTRAGQVEALFDLGRWDEVDAIAREMEAFDREGGGGQIRTFAQIYRGAVLTYRGSTQDATLLTEEFLPRVRIIHRVEFLAPALVVAATNEATRGHAALATVLVDEFLLETQRHPGYRVQHLPQALRVLQQAGMAREDLLPSEPPTNTRDRNARATAEALLAEAHGDLEGARARFASAGAAWLAYGSVLELASARLGEGRCALALGDRSGAPGPLREARARFQTVGAAPRIAEVDALLADD
jgi:class 3 adenylate cyclase/tetratricopeptide (TPR) repeat protein